MSFILKQFILSERNLFHGIFEFAKIQTVPDEKIKNKIERRKQRLENLA